ncbi:MAG: hypothetical protein K9M84_04840 [Spirochaetia bacterium]|nr:hypothetical protein [Spirochaetia bacterium]MCF7940916.1 hypothetical protein [Spirochaetia bacterium]
MIRKPAHTLRYVMLLLLGSIALSSCTIEQEIFIDIDSSGSVYFDVTVEEFFNAVVEDFTVFLPEEESDVTDINMKELQDSINESPYASRAELFELEKNRYTGTFQFGNAEAFFNDVNDELKLESLFDFSTRGDLHTLRLYLDIDNYGELTELIPLLKDPSFSIFGPEENIGVSEADYLDMISYLLGEEGPGAIERSYISLIINTETPVVSVKNGTKLSARQVEFRIPIIDFLLLAEPVDYSVTW